AVVVTNQRGENSLTGRERSASGTLVEKCRRPEVGVANDGDGCGIVAETQISAAADGKFGAASCGAVEKGHSCKSASYGKYRRGDSATGDAAAGTSPINNESLSAGNREGIQRRGRAEVNAAD